MVELQEAYASCQVREARLEASLQETSWERRCWEAGTFAGLAYGLTQHVLRPLWLIHCESEFPLDRCALLHINLFFLSFIFLLIILLLFKDLHLDHGGPLPDGGQLQRQVHTPLVRCIRCLGPAGPREGKCISIYIIYLVHGRKSALPPAPSLSLSINNALP